MHTIMASHAATARQGTEVGLASAVHHALQGTTPHTHHTPNDRHESAPKRDDRQNNIEIVVNTDVLTLRGAGVEVTPALLSGQVVLDLAESTTVKQVTLQFRGKAKLPPIENELVSFSHSTMTYVVCNHEWSFLEGEKKHSHTLKAGRHIFPFQLNLGGSLPSTLYTSTLGGASVAYKLRAVATRPGFAHNLQTQRAITLLRSFPREALEYQQSLEIENTWPEKIMYSIMIPHKAWAAGDDLTAVVKLSPLAKGGRVISVVTTLNETIKVHNRTGWQESTKPVITARHEFRNGQAVWVDHRDHRSRSGSSHQSGTRIMHPGPPALTQASNSVHPQHSSPHDMYFLPTGNQSRPGESPLPQIPDAGPSTTSPRSPIPSTEPASEVPIEFELSEEDIATQLEISLPLFMTPTHVLEPIMASHRIRWTILIGNPDGHTSELRCSLPLHILDCRFLNEAKSATAEMRRLLLGGPDVPAEFNPDLELPSYPSHIRDRIANMYLPDQAVLRVTNPWIDQGISPVQLEPDQDGRQSNITTGTHTPIEAHFVSPLRGDGDSDLEYVSSELLLSLSQHAPPPIETHRETASPLDTAPPSRSTSRGVSRVPSLIMSRASSPDHEREASQPHSRSHSRRSSASADGAPSTYLHSDSTASRNLHGLFHVTMKPLTSLTSSLALQAHHLTPPPPPLLPAAPAPAPAPHSRSHSHTHPHPHPRQQQQHSPPGTGGAAALPRTVPVTSHSLLHRAFTEVPDYGIASRGFLGGVTPLETLQGLPSYEEAEMQRSRSESDLASLSTSTSRRHLSRLHSFPARLEPLRTTATTD
ncbi:hypothetical protein BC826DRAFT_948710 [Russula brevipes]|nr:hypothetical protein BC826DRAFT_948710 [Russula brevipes]